MGEILYINGVRADVMPRSVSRNLQINNFKEITNRQANYSNQIKLPLTAHNVTLFDNVALNGNTSNKPYENVVVKYLVDGVELISKGKGVLKTTNNYLNLVIYDGNIDLTDLLAESTLADLSYTTYNHNLNYTTFFNSQTNTSGYVYPSRASTAQNVYIDIYNTIPVFYIHTLIDMIFTQAGWTISGDLLTDTNYKSRVMTMKQGFPTTISGSVTNQYTQAHSTSHVYSSTIDTTDTIEIDPSTGGSRFLATTAGVHEVRFNGSFTIGIEEDNNVTLNIKKNGVQIYQISNLEHGESITDKVQVYLAVNDNISTEVVIQAKEVGPNDFEYQVTENFTTYIDLDTQYIDVDFEDIIGDMKQIDLVKDVLQRFNVMIRKTSDTNLEFKLGENVLNNTSVDDWSDKFVQLSSSEYTPSYAQRNYFRYNYDNTNDDETKDFADGTLALNNQNIPIEKEILKSVFKASETIAGTIFGSNLYFMDYWEADETPKEDGYRIFKLNTSSQAITYRLRSTDAYNTETKTMAFMDFTDLSYQTELDDNYPTYKTMNEKFVRVEIIANLDLFDIYNIDFFKPKFFKQTGRKYYLEKINNFRNRKLTKINLIQIPI